MKFTTSCFVCVEDVEKRTKLLEWAFDMGYAGRYRIDETYPIVAAGLEKDCVDVAATNAAEGLVAYGLIDCGENIELFKALAAMNDENDLNQYFIDERNGSMNFSECAHIGINALVYHKATTKEIIEYFKKRENDRR